MRVRPARPGDAASLARLIAEFRVALARFRGVAVERDIEAGGEELAAYEKAGCPVFVAEREGGGVVGYLVCRVADDVVWAESLFVRPESRRQGVASALYAEAERLAAERGSDPVYNWVHPNNDAIIAFLRVRGYRVLNLIELRRPRPGEEPARRIQVGKHEFDY